MRKILRVSCVPSFAAILSLVLASAAQADTIVVDLGQSAENFVLTGLGANATGNGTYNIQQGSCSSAANLTTCVLSGAITGSTPPGFSPGTYSFVTTYATTDVTPVHGRSQTPGSNSFVYDSLAPDVSMVLNLTVGGTTFVEPLVTGGQFNPETSFFFTYTGTVTCTGVAVCTQANVGYVNGATISGPVTITSSFPKPSLVNSFLYTNSGSSSFSSPNIVSAFSVKANGSLIPVPGSPFVTGGNGGGPGSAITVVGNHLYVYNGQSENNVTGFSINPTTGILTAVPHSPFPTGELYLVNDLAGTPDGKYLIASGPTRTRPGENATVFEISDHGALTIVPGSPFALGPFGFRIKITPDGRFLLAAGGGPYGGIGVYSISPAGTLSPVADSPFLAGTAGGIDVDCSSTFGFTNQRQNAPSPQSFVSVFSIATSGFLTPLQTFTGPPQLRDPSDLLLSTDDKKLFVSGSLLVGPPAVTVFGVDADGRLSEGSPFHVDLGLSAFSRMGVTADGKFLYTGMVASKFPLAVTPIFGFSIAADGTLTQIPGSPFSFPHTRPQRLTIYPAKTCSIER